MLGENVKKRRTQLNMTQEQLAQAAGYHSRSTINKIESELRDVPYTKIIELAKALKTSPSYLMGLDDTVIPVGKSRITIIRKGGRNQTHKEVYINETDADLIEQILDTMQAHSEQPE